MKFNEEYYTYLDDLQKSGVTNMLAATPYLVEEFGVDRKEARKILKDWIETYDKRRMKNESSN